MFKSSLPALFCATTLLAGALLAGALPAVAAPPEPIHISVDASRLGTNRIYVHMVVPAKAGDLKLVYPSFLPGGHALEGPLGNIARIQTSGGGKPLTWNRDPYNPYLLHVTVPKGVSTVTVSYEYIFPFSGEEVFYGVAASKSIAVINPASFALAPEGKPASLPVSLEVDVPHGWGYSSAMKAEVLDHAVANANQSVPSTTLLKFAPTTLYTMIDSPIMVGQYHKAIPIPTTDGDVPHTLDIFAETEAGLQKEITLTPLVTRLVAESRKLFGVRHYNNFHFMVALTAAIPRNGLEHHASVAYVFSPNDFDRAAQRLGVKFPAAPSSAPPRPASFNSDQWTMNLLPHEFVHSWNGKYRRPYGEMFPTNTAPQSADLVWMYEGLTEYLGELLMVRSGFSTPEAWRTSLRSDMLLAQSRNAFDWQTIADAALVMPYTYIHGDGTAMRPVNDVYMDGRLIWLEADTIIRQQSGGKRTLTDFCHIFFGGPNNGAEAKSYTRKDIVAALNQTEKYDWEGFIQERFYTPQTDFAPRALKSAGWELQLTEAPLEFATDAETNYRYSLGFTVNPDGSLFVSPNSVADKAGIKTGMTLLGVNGFKFSTAKLREQVRQTGTPGAKKSIELLVSDNEQYQVVKIDGLSGEKYPVLARRGNQPDLLTAITQPLDAPLPPVPVSPIPPPAPTP